VAGILTKRRIVKVPFYKPSLTSAEIDEVVETLRGGWLTTGAKTKEFERDFCAYIGQKHSIAVNSCTAALHLALEAIGVKAGDGVLVPTMTFAATAEVARYLGANPILVDCRKNDFNMDVADAERRLLEARGRGQNVVAIMPVHYAGQVGDVDGYVELARKYGLKIVEDAAHCCPAHFQYKGDAASGEWHPVGSSADISCFSFYANKCITTGEGGMACTMNDAYADRMRIMSLHGISRDAWKRFTGEGTWYYEIIAPGFKYNLTDIASAIGVHQLRRSDELHRRRERLASRYREVLGDLDEIILPEIQPRRIHSWHLFVVRLKLDRLAIHRGEFIEKMKAAGIICSVHYTPLHMHPYYREKFGYRNEDLPQMTEVYPEIFTLPLYPDMTDEEFEHVCGTVRGILLEARKTVVAL
jgi:dTDP-4-amino-4,6-dideoxygalactose transaminase